MQITGTLTRRGGTWKIRDSVTGRTYELSGEDFPDRAEGLQAQVVGVTEDSFGLGVLHDEPVLRVQRWRAV